MDIANPKLTSRDKNGRNGWYPYYAGYSYSFASRLLASSGLTEEQVVLDPWNGSGTTTTAAMHLGLASYGFDLNPVTLLVAKARLLSTRTYTSVKPLALDIVEKARTCIHNEDVRHDPLNSWFTKNACSDLRSLEWAIQSLLTNLSQPTRLSESRVYSHISDLASFFYLALFRTVRILAANFFGSNPTWVRVPKDGRYLLRPSHKTICSIFIEQTDKMISSSLHHDDLDHTQVNNIHLAESSSNELPLNDETIDFVLTSPPYCTRLDYAVATRLELALLGYDLNSNGRLLRNELIGTTSINNKRIEQKHEWGVHCNNFLTSVHEHGSKASRSYYYKNMANYFDSMYSSISEVSRVLKPDAKCVLVVQDSYYKDIHNNLPLIITDIFASFSMKLLEQADFSSRRSFGNVNPGNRFYRNINTITESVLCFQKN